MTEPAMFVFDPLQVNGGRVRRAEGDDGVKMDTYVKSGEWHKAQAEVDRLRDERDRAIRAMEAEVDGSREAWAKVAEARRVAGVLADALRNAPCHCDHPLRAGLPPCSRCSALAVFDTLTEEKT